jgi:hypothetical protein
MKPTEKDRIKIEQVLRDRLIDVEDADVRNSNEPITSIIAQEVYGEDVDTMNTRRFSRMCKMVDKEVRRISANTRRRMKGDMIKRWNLGGDDNTTQNPNQKQKKPRKSKRIDDLLLYAIEVPNTRNKKKGEETEPIYAYVNVLKSRKLLKDKAASLDKYGANVLAAATTLADYAARTWTRGGWRRK